MRFGSTSTFERAGTLKTTRMPDGVVAYQDETERFHYLNPTAVIVYELCTAGRSLGEIADYLQSAFALPHAPLEDVARCAELLVSERLIEPQQV